MFNRIARQLAEMSGQLDELRRRGQHAEALELARRLCDLTRQHRGADHPDFAATLVTLAELHGMTGQCQAAAQFYQQALAIHEAVPRPDEEAIGLLLGNLAGLYQTIGDYAAAEPLYRRSIEVLRRARGEEDLILATTLSSLAVLCQRVGDYTGAEGLLMRSLEIRGKALGEGHEAYATSLHDLAALYMAVGRFEAAEDLLRRVIEIQSLVLPENHPEIADGLSDLGALLSAASRDVHSLDERDERLSEAETLLRRALEIRLSAFGENHLSVAESLRNLAGWYRAVRHYGAAEGRLIEAVGSRAGSSAPTTPSSRSP
jgi:tetratricopeptide (TPR) repeat protein